MALLARVLSALAVRSSSSSSSSNFLFVLLLLSFATTSSLPLAVACADSIAFIVVGLVCELMMLLLVVVLLVVLVPLGAMSNPACVNSKSLTALRWLSSSLSSSLRAASRSASFLFFSARFSSFFCARMLARAHSRQNMSPRWQETGSRAISRHKPQEPNGRKESRLRRAEESDHADFARARSWEVKTGREVFRLPGGSRSQPWLVSGMG